MNMDEMIEVAELQVGKLALAPDDVLVMKLDRELPDVIAKEMVARIERRYGFKTMVIGPGIELSVVSKAEAARIEGGKLDNGKTEPKRK